MTSSLCNPNNSGFANNTRFRSLKSVAASCPDKIGVRPSLTTEVARDVEAREAGSAAGVAAFNGVRVDAAVTGPFKLGVPVAVAGAVGAPVLRLRLMMLVNSVLNVSRSAYAMSGGVAVNVKLCPASSWTSPSFSRTCAAPSLLQKSAVGCKSVYVNCREWLTGGVLVGYAYRRGFFTVLSPLEMAVCELERASKFFVRRLGCGHAGRVEGPVVAQL